VASKIHFILASLASNSCKASRNLKTLATITGYSFKVKSMRVRPESVTHIVVKLFNVKSKFDYIDKNKQKSEITNNDKFEKRKHIILTELSKIVGPIGPSDKN
jgi:hypothetical protein